MNDPNYTADGIKIDTDSEFEEFWLKDYKNNIDVKGAVNWNKAVMPCKMIHLGWRDKRGFDQELVLDREELQTIMFLFAPTEDESKYLRQRTSELKKQRHQMKIKVTRDVKKGDSIIVNKNFTI